MNNIIEIAKISHKRPDKTKNGDFCTFELLSNEHLAIIVLGDGVSSCPCDWRASQLGCEAFIATFKNYGHELDLKQRIYQSVQDANIELLMEPAPCEGLKSTFSLIVWNLLDQETFWVNIGDSRIYGYTPQDSRQISIDEVAPEIIRKKDGSAFTNSGFVFTREGVTNVLGIPEPKIIVSQLPSDDLFGFVLASDGFYNCASSFSKDCIHLLNSMNLEASLIDLYHNYKDYQSDDMSLIAIRRIDTSIDQHTLLDLISQKDKGSFSDFAIKKSIIENLESCIRNHDVEVTQKLIAYAQENQFDLSRKYIGDLISLMIKSKFEHSAIYQALSSMIRRSKL